MTNVKLYKLLQIKLADIGIQCSNICTWCGISGGPSDCSVGKPPHICNRVTNSYDMGSFFRSALIHYPSYPSDARPGWEIGVQQSDKR